MEHLLREGAVYLDAAVSLGDLMITAINDPKTGVIIPEDGDRSPVLVKYQEPKSRGYKDTIAVIRARSPREAETYEREQVPIPQYAWLSTAMALEGPVELAQVTQLAGGIGVFGSAKADSWQKSSLHLYDFVDATQPSRQRQA